MLKGQPFKWLPPFPAIGKFTFKFILGVFLLSYFSLFFNLKPTFAQTIPIPTPNISVPVISPIPTPTPINSPSPIPTPSPAAPITPPPDDGSPKPVFQLPHPGYISTYFSAYHPGVDIATGLGMPIKPVGKGVVVDTGFNFWGLGLIVEIDHGNGYHSLYAHMGRIFVKKGQGVDVGDILGEVGLTGHTTGPHTHLEISKNGTRVNPLTYLPEIRAYPVEADFKQYGSASQSAALAQAENAPSSNTFAASSSAQLAYAPIPSATPSPSPLPDWVTKVAVKSTPKPDTVVNMIKEDTSTLNTNKTIALNTSVNIFQQLSAIAPKTTKGESISIIPDLSKDTLQKPTVLALLKSPQPKLAAIPKGGEYNLGILGKILGIK